MTLPQFPTFVFDQRYRLGDRAFCPIIGRVHRRFGQLDGVSTILEFGSGNGRFARFAPSSRSWRVFGLDKSPTAIAGFKKSIGEQSLPDTAIEADFLDPRVDLSSYDFKGALAWRVIHTMPPNDQLKACQKVFELLPVGASFFISLLSDVSWERNVLGDDYVPGVPNNLRRVMQFDQIGLDQDWLFSFFDEARARQLALETGFEVVGDIVRFEEANGWSHLYNDHPNQTWLFIELRKPPGNQAQKLW